MGVYDEQLNLFESSDDGAFLRTIKRILRKSKYRYLKNFRQLFDNESDMKNMKRAIEKPSHGKISVFRTKCILDKLGLKYSITNNLKLTIYIFARRNYGISRRNRCQISLSQDQYTAGN